MTAKRKQRAACRHPKAQRITLWATDMRSVVEWCPRCGALSWWINDNKCAWRLPARSGQKRRRV